jgi:polyisoprenoid-binding protein YceI
VRKLLLGLAVIILWTGTARAEDLVMFPKDPPAAVQSDAKNWQIDYDHSSLGFIGNQNGEQFAGGFKKFTALIAMNPDHPETGKIAVTVDIASVYAGTPDRDQMLPQKDWFDTSHFPQAQFTSTAIRKIGPIQYAVDGNLTIKGFTHFLTLPFTLMSEGDHWHAKGRVTLMRTDFGIGMGSFAGEAYVKHAVDVVIDIVAK